MQSKFTRELLEKFILNYILHDDFFGTGTVGPGAIVLPSLITTPYYQRSGFLTHLPSLKRLELLIMDCTQRKRYLVAYQLCIRLAGLIELIPVLSNIDNDVSRNAVW